jgi:putative membrane protein
MAAFGSGPVVAFSQGSQTATSITGDATDGKILSDMMATNSYNLGLMKIAMQKAQTLELRDAAGGMINDHQRLDAQLTALANRLNFAMDAEKREKYADKLGKWDRDAATADWDEDVIEDLVDTHKDGIDQMERAQLSAKDVALKALVEQSIPMMRSHLDVLMPLKGTIKDAEGKKAIPATSDRTDAEADMRGGIGEDAKFFSDMRMANLYELKLMELIFKKSGNRDLKNAAQRMIEDHQLMERKTRDYGTRMKFGMNPDEASKVNEKLVKWNEKKGGMEWDADIIEELIDAHKDGVDMLEDSKGDVKDDNLKAVIEEALATKRKHLEMIAPLKETIKKPWNNK